MQRSFPRLEMYLPALMAYGCDLAFAYERDRLNTWAEMDARVKSFFTPEVMADVEAVIPGWGRMAGYGDGITLVHTMTALTGLLLEPHYEHATPAQQGILHWAVLLHDLSKVVEPGRRDLMHAFRSAALAAPILLHSGFPTLNPGQIADWAALTHNASKTRAGRSDPIPDISQLPQILAGVDSIFGAGSPAARILQVVLFHYTLTTLAEWPAEEELSPAEIDAYMDAEFLQLLRLMVLADSAGWELFNTETHFRYREEILETFERIHL